METIIDLNSQKHIIGLLVKNTQLLSERMLTEDDFADYEEYAYDSEGIVLRDPETMQALIDETKTIPFKDIFSKIETAYKAGQSNMYGYDFRGYAKQIKQWCDGTVSKDFDYYYESLKKTTLLREAAKVGTVIKKYIWHENDDPDIKKEFDIASIEDVSNAIQKQVGDVVIKQSYTNNNNIWRSSDDPDKLWDDFIKSNPWGHRTMSSTLNAMIHGWVPGTFTEIIASSGAGKSMMSFSNIAYGFANKMYIKDKWVERPTNEHYMYIGTEMDIKEACYPQVVCCTAGLDWNKVKLHDFSVEEMNRYKEAQRVLFSENNIMIKNDNYDRIWLNNYINGHPEINTVFLDYLEVTSGMYDKNKDDATILNELAAYCKNKLVEKDIALIAFAQANQNIEKKKLSEIDASCIKGSHMIHQKADTLLYLISGVEDDMKLLSDANGGEGFLRNTYFDKYPEIYIDGLGTGRAVNPARIRKILIGDKNRADTSMRGKCLWCYVEDGTLRWHDLFVTDNEYRIVKVEPKEL